MKSTKRQRSARCVATGLLSLVLASGCGTSGATARLMEAVVSGSTADAATALRAGGDPNYTDASRSSPLPLAASRGDLAMVDTLLAAGARVNHRPVSFWSGYGRTALEAAIGTGRLDMIEHLLTLGADPALPDRGGRTALHFAVQCASAAPAELLLKHMPALVDMADKTGLTPLYWAAARPGEGGADVVEVLLRHGASPSLAPGPLFITPLQEAAAAGNLRSVRLLLAAGADPNAGGRGKAPALSMAAIHGHVEVVRVLLAAGADANATDYGGVTAVGYAQRFGHDEIVTILSNRPSS